MIDDQELLETIKNYLRHQMPPEQVLAFEAQMRADAALAKHVSDLKTAFAVLDRSAERDMREKIGHWLDPKPDEEPRLSFFATYKRWFLAAAALLLLALAFWFLTGPKQSRSEEHMIKGKETPTALPRDSAPIDPGAKLPPFTPPPGSSTRPIAALAEPGLDQYGKNFSGHLRSANQPAASAEETLLHEADSLLAAKKYNTALRVLQQMPAGAFDLSKHGRLVFAYHKLGQHAQAIEAYEQYADLDPSNEEEHDWYRCLLYLADHPRHEKAFRSALQKMTANPNHPYHEKALALQKALVNNDER